MSDIKNIAVLTSGGDAPGMNAAIRAVVRAAIYYGMDVYGIREGYQGMIDDKFEKMNARSVKNIINRGGTILKSARSIEFKTPEGRKKAFDNLQKRNIDAIVVIGGDGTFTGATIFEKEYGVKCVGIPGTIDNDISGTDFTLGFDTAVNTVVEAVDKIRDTASSHNRMFFIEVMGRDSGYIALYSGIAAGAEKVLIPETGNEMEQLEKTLEHGAAKRKSSNIVIVAEGDQTGGAVEIAKMTKEKFPDYDIKVTILGHIQRGGSPTYFDRMLASRLGVKAVEMLKLGRTGIMVGTRNNAITSTRLTDAIKEHSSMDPELFRVAEIVSI